MNARFLDEAEEEAPSFGFTLIAVLLTLAAIASGVYFGYAAGDRQYLKQHQKQRTGLVCPAPDGPLSLSSEPCKNA